MKDNCEYKKICNRHSTRVLNCVFPSLCQYKERYNNYNALFSQTAKETIPFNSRTRLSGFDLEEVMDMIELNGYIGGSK